MCNAYNWVQLWYTIQHSSDNLPSYPPDTHHSLDNFLLEGRGDTTEFIFFKESFNTPQRPAYLNQQIINLRLSIISLNCSININAELEGTHRVQTHAVLLLTLTLILTFDLSTQNHITCRISQGHSVYQVRTLWDHLFLSYALDISVR